MDVYYNIKVDQNEFVIRLVVLYLKFNRKKKKKKN